VSFSSSCWRLAIDTVLEVVWSWWLLRVVVLGRIAGTWAVPLKSSLTPQAFQCLDSVGGHRRFLSFYVQPVIAPLDFGPQTQLGVLAVAVRNIAVSVDFAIVGELAQTVLPGGAVVVLLRRLPFETQAFQCLNPQGGQRRRLFF
jgi:hypothetical protein